MGMPFRDLLEMAGGVQDGRALKAVIPGGSSVPVVPADAIMECTMDYDGLSQVGSALGAGSVIVMDETTCMVEVLERISFFYFAESCGQCTPCREGTSWLEDFLIRMEKGDADKREIPMLEEISRQIEGHTICALGDAAAWPVQGLVRHFKKDIEERIDDPEGYDYEGAFQKAWSGDPFANDSWVKDHGDGLEYHGYKQQAA